MKSSWSTCRHATFASAVICLVMGRATQAAEFTDLMRRLPEGGNAVVVVNAAKVFGSPLAQREGWQQKYADAFEATPLILPPTATQCVMGAKFDLDSILPEWQAAVMELAIDPTPADVAKRRGGTVDSLAGVDAVWLQGKACILKFGPRLFGVFVPATRQEASAWAAASKSPDSAQMSPYLMNAVGYADTVGTEVILAIDLRDAFRLEHVRAAVSKSELLKDVPAEQATAILASLQGVKLGVLVTDRLVGRLQFDFAEDPAVLAKVAKPLMLQLVGKAGAMLDEFNTWEPVVDGHSLALKGDLTNDGMRRLFSVLAIDAGAVDRDDANTAPSSSPAAAPAPEPAAKQPSIEARASLRYFKGLSEYVDDAQRIGRANSFDQAEFWIENYARKVEMLPTRNVDPELVQYGKYVAQSFRAIVAQANGVAQKVDALDSSDPDITSYHIGLLPTARTVNYGGYFMRQYAPYGYADFDPAAGEQKRQQTQEEVYQAVQSAKMTISQLAADQQTVRSKLTERYGLSF